MVKLVAVIYLAAYLTKKADKITLFRDGLLPALIVDRTAQRTGVARAGSWDGRGARAGDSLVCCFLAGARISHLLDLGLCAIPVVLVLVLGPVIVANGS